MSYDSYHKRKIGKHVLKPETQMMGYGYDPSLSEGSLKPPIFLTSTFVFRRRRTARIFSTTPPAVASRQRVKSSGLVYSRFNNPNLEVLEDRLALWEEGETAAVFSSGMSAISTVHMDACPPGRRHFDEPAPVRRHGNSDRKDPARLRGQRRRVSPWVTTGAR